MTMNKHVKQKWVEALRSGEYQQTRGVLSNGYGHCCLGVLCELAVTEGVIGPATDEYDATWYDGSYKILPYSVAEWAGLILSDPEVMLPPKGPASDKRVAALSSINDNGAPFTEIADIIESAL